VTAVALIGIPAAGGPPEIRCRLADDRISESSGIAASSSSDEVVFTHNDSGDRARFFAVDTGTCATRATFTVTGATNLDWEDMARGQAADGSPVLWLADIGDNQARRASVVVYEVDEPGPGATDGAVKVRARSTLTYPDGAHDAETLLVDPETGRPVIVTKDTEAGRSRAYRLPSTNSGVLERIADLEVAALPGGGLFAPSWSVTGGATSPDRRIVVLRSYLAAWAWTATPGEALATVLGRRPTALDLPVDRQAEAVSFTRDGSGLWLTSEGAGSSLHQVVLPPVLDQPSDVPPAPSPPVARVPERGERMRSVTVGVTIVVVGLLVLVGVVVGVRAARRPRH